MHPFKMLLLFVVLMGTPLTMMVIALPEGTWRVEARVFSLCFVFLLGVYTASELFNHRKA